MNQLELEKIANTIRKETISMIYNAKSGHPGGALSAIDIFTYLYFDEMNVDSSDPEKEDRDRFVLSKGHTVPGLYAVLAEKGYFPKEILKSYRKMGTILQGHPDIKKTPGIDMSTGSLGQGISAAVGMAFGAKAKNKEFRVYTMVGDGEIDEGQVWEAAMFAAHRKLDNLCVIVDNNGLQLDGTIEEIIGADPLDKKFEAFGFCVIEADGHDFGSLKEAFAKARNVKGKPTAIIAKTVKGKGVSFMENNVAWHGAAPNEEQYRQAMEELEKEGAALCQKERR
ncbi:MAG: transketolase [Eubacteriales bacterium]|nr:transketolase [Eubacteriales bacterium]